MKISARVDNSRSGHQVSAETNGAERSLPIPARDSGFGSAVNGGELLCLTLATCHCNDIYREAAKRGIAVKRVEVEVHAESAAKVRRQGRLLIQQRVEADADAAEIRELIAHTDTVAEIQNTLRRSTKVLLEEE